VKIFLLFHRFRSLPSRGTTLITAFAPYPARTLRRSRNNRIISGLCQGLGTCTGIHPLAFRAGFILLALFDNAGLLFYTLGWIIVPFDNPAYHLSTTSGHSAEEDRPHAHTSDMHASSTLSLETTRRTLGLGILGTALLVLLSTGSRIDFAEFVTFLASIGAIFFFLSHPPTNQSVKSLSRQAATRFAPSNQSSHRPSPPDSCAVSPPTDPIPAEPRQDKKQASVTTIILVLIFFCLGGIAVLDFSGTEITNRTYLVIPLTGTAIGFIAGCWTGRARGLIFLGIPLIFLLVYAQTPNISHKKGEEKTVEHPAPLQMFSFFSLQPVPFLSPPKKFWRRTHEQKTPMTKNTSPHDKPKNILAEHDSALFSHTDLFLTSYKKSRNKTP